MPNYQIAIEDDNAKHVVLEERDGRLPQKGDIVEVRYGNELVEMSVMDTVLVHRQDGAIIRVVLDADTD